jgi:methionyl-tRNA formyltransferase
MRTVYLGTSDFAATVLDRLAVSAHRPVLVVTRPDALRGRGRKLARPPVAERAGPLGIELSQPENVNDDAARRRISAARPEKVLICAYGALIREPLLSEHEMLNVHPSLLPRWRGAAPIERAIMAGDRETGVTIMRVTAGLDSGPVVLQGRTPIEPGDDYGSLARRMAELAGELAVRALDLLAADELEAVEQDEALATYAEKIRPEERRLDPARPAVELQRAVRALAGHVGAYLELDDGSRLGVHAAGAEPGDLAVGEVVAADGSIRVGCGTGVLLLEVVQPPGGRPMPVDGYLRGHPAPRLGVAG